MELRETQLREDRNEICEHSKRGQCLIHLTVRDKKFVLERRCLEKYPDSKLSRMLLLLDTTHTLSDGSFYLSFNPFAFSLVIDWLSDGQIPTFSEKEFGIKEAVVKLSNELGFFSLAKALSPIEEEEQQQYISSTGIGGCVGGVVKISQKEFIKMFNSQIGGGTVSLIVFNFTIYCCLVFYFFLFFYFYLHSFVTTLYLYIMIVGLFVCF